MENPVNRKRERGELSLFWCVVLFALLSLIMMTWLMSFRYNRNLFVEAWDHVAGQATAQVGSTLKAAAEPAAAVAPGAEVRKCVVNGKVLYSNVECGAENSTSRKVDVRPTEGMGSSTPAKSR
jgi:hypothetical protein